MAISISDDFDGGNIEVVTGSGGDWTLAIRPDNMSHYFQWFYFSVEDASGVDLTLRISNAGQSAYPEGWKDYRALASEDNENWSRVDTGFNDGVLTIRMKPTRQKVWFAYFTPYQTGRHEALIRHFKRNALVRHSVFGKSLDGSPLDLLTIGSGPLQIWIYGRQHPGESMAEWWMEGALQALTESSAAALRSACTIYVAPNMNPDGTARGHLRTNAVGIDLNREWASPTVEKSPEVFAILNLMEAYGVDFALDVHGDESIPHVFIAGADGIPSWTAEMGRIQDRFISCLVDQTADFQPFNGYPTPEAGQANLAISTNALGERFGSLSMTLEMPFKDHSEAPDVINGWSSLRSERLGAACVSALVEMVDDLAAYRALNRFEGLIATG